MKKTLHFLWAFAILLSGCTTDSSDLDALSERVDNLELSDEGFSSQILTLTEQVAAITTSIDDLKTTQTDLSDYITALESTSEELQDQITSIESSIASLSADVKALEDEDNTEELEAVKSELMAELAAVQTELESELEQIDTTITTLQEKDAAIELQLASLQAYVYDDLGDDDWGTITFATLEQYNALSDEVATIKESVTALNTSLSDLEIKLTEEYTESIEIAINTLDGEIAEELTTLTSEITTAYTAAISTAKSDIETAYTTAIETSIETLEASMKEWVNEQFTGYYTIAQTEAALETLESELAADLAAQKSYLESLVSDLSDENETTISTIESELEAINEAISENAAEISDLKSLLETTKSDITTAYESAIESAISTFEGEIRDDIATEVSTINTRITDELDAVYAAITALGDRVTDLESDVATIKDELLGIQAKITNILARIQSIVFVSEYSDGNATMLYDEENGISAALYYKLTPASTAEDLVSVWRSALSVNAYYTLTRAAAAIGFMDLEILDVSAADGILTVIASGEELDYDYLAGNITASVCLNISDGNNDLSSEFVNMVSEVSDSNLPTNQLPYATDLVATAGNERVLISYTVPEDEQITGVLFSDGTTEYTEEITAEDLGQTLEYSFEGLSAGDVVVSVQMTCDDEESASIVVSAESVAVYDNDTYASEFSARQILDASHDGTSATITLFPAEDCGDTYITYGDYNSDAIAYSEEVSVVTFEATQGDDFTISTEYLPYEDALDLVVISYEDVVPGEMTDDMVGFFMNGDALPLNYATSLLAGSDVYTMAYGIGCLYDNNLTGSFYHTDTDFYGRTVTLDLGYEMEMTNFKFWPRSTHYYTSHAPKTFALYASNVLTADMQTAGDETTPSFEGWTQIGESVNSSEFSTETNIYYSCPPSGSTSPTSEDQTYVNKYGQLFKVDTKGESYRYVRLLWYSNWGGSNNIEVGEFQVMGKFVREGTDPEVVVDNYEVFSTLDNVSVAAGDERAVVSVTLPSDDGSDSAEATDIIIQDALGSELTTYTIASGDWGNTVNIDVANLSTGSTKLYVLLSGGDYYSASTELSTTVYDDSSLSAPSVSAEYDGATGFTLTFDTSSIYDETISVTYTENGTETTVDATAGVLEVTSVSSLATYTYTTTALPYENALDKISVTATGTFPIYATQVSSAGFATLTLDGDAGVQNNYKISALWDGVVTGSTTGNFYHNAQYSYGQTLTIDLGAEYDLGYFKIYQRNDRCYTLNNIRTFRIYGCTTDPDGNADLEKTITYSAEDYSKLTGVTLQNSMTEVTVPDLSSWTELYTYQEDKGYSAVCAANSSSHAETGLADVAIIPDPVSTWYSTSTDAMKAEALLGDGFAIPEGNGKAIRYIRIQPMSCWKYVPSSWDGWVQFAQVEFFLED